MSHTANHWDSAYAQGYEERSWYQLEASLSLELIGGEANDRSVVDVGGGASVLVDDLLACGFSDLTVVDVSDRGLAIARQRLGTSAQAVDWMVADVRAWRPARTFDVWHDRAVVHFLTEVQQRLDYRATLLKATRPGALAVIGTFGPDGPQQCSGLPVMRHDAASIAAVLGPQFEVTDSRPETHQTPAGGSQQFLWVRAVRTS